MTDFLKIPVEYTIITTSDWTQFDIIQGGTWESISTECVIGQEKLTKEIASSVKSIRIEKEGYDETPVILRANGLLTIKKEKPYPEIQYQITKGSIRSTTVIITVNKKTLEQLVNEESGSDLNPVIYTSPSQDYLRDLTKQKVFIINGRDRYQALLLKDFLRKYKVDAITLEDITDEGKTIFQKLHDTQNQITYAIAILTPDDIGCLRSSFKEIETTRKAYPKEELEKILALRARQNVLFELGLFIGALGKENICYLKQKDLKEIPSDLNGVMYKEFDKTVEDTFHKLQEELFL
jgi:predicted nucleotide-binding protein